MGKVVEVTFGREERWNNMKKNGKYLINFSLLHRIPAWFVKLLITCVLIIFLPILFSIQVKNKRQFLKFKRAQKNGLFLTSNHCYYVDGGMTHYALFPFSCYFTADEPTMNVKGLGTFLRLLGVFPLPENQGMKIGRTISEAIRRRKIIHFFAEGNMLDYNQEVAELKNGLFYFSYQSKAPVIPLAIVLKRRKIVKSLTKPFPKVLLVFGEPIFPADYFIKGVSKNDSLKMMSLAVKNSLQSMIDQHGGDKTLFEGKIDHRV